MTDSIAKFKRKLRVYLGKGTVKAKAKAKNRKEEDKRQSRLRTKYPQMYEPGKTQGTRSVMDAVRKMDPSSVSKVGRSRTRVLKKKYK